MLSKQSVVGVEIDNDRICAVEISYEKRAGIISAYGKLELEKPVFFEGDTVNRELLSEKLNELFQNAGIKARDVVVGIGGRQIILRLASFTKVPYERQRRMILLNAQEFIPVPLAELELDYLEAGESENENGRLVNVLLVASRRSLVEGIADTVNDMRLEIQDITSSMLAISEALKTQALPETYMLIRIDRSVMSVLIYRNGNIVFARDMQMADIAEDIAPSGKESPAEKELLQINSAVLNGIRSSVNYYTGETGVAVSRAIERIFLIVRDAGINEMVKMVSDTFNISVEALSMYTNMPSAAGSLPNGYEGCVSLVI
jgi:type IV pilus assembly protein PilM